MVLRERLMKKYAGIMMVSLMLTAVGSMQAVYGEEFTFQQGMDGYTGGQDRTISNAPQPSETRLRIKYYNGEEIYNTIIRFDNIEDELNGAIVTSAILTLTYRDEHAGYTPAMIDIYPCLKHWMMPDWYNATPTITWDTSGAQGEGDRGTLNNSVYMGYRSYGGTEYPDWGKYDFTLSTDLVQSWIDEPDSNHGVILTMNPSFPTDVTFVSNEDFDPCCHPVLTIIAVPPVEVPDVSGWLISEAVTELENDGFIVEIEPEYSTVPEYHVIRQDPCADTVVPTGSTVTLWESWGPQPMPDFNGDYITNLIDFNQLASEWLICDRDVVTTDMTADGCVQVDDLVFLVERWLQYHCKNRPEADIDGDCRVDMDDLAILLSEWLMCDDETMANLDGDDEGCVDLSDMSILSSQWGLCGEAYNQ